MSRLGYEVDVDALGSPSVVERLETRRVLVTGASGLLGAGVARVLAEAGNHVTTLQRRPSGVPGVRDVRGSVTDPAAVEEAMDGAGTVVHVAAKVSVSGPESEFAAVNVEGTRHVLDAARRQGVRRFVHVSSPSVAHAGDSIVGEGAGPASPEHAEHPKATAEQQAIALEAARIMTTWTPDKDATQTHAELRARHLMTAERAARVITPERPSSGAEWTAAAKEKATSEPVVSLNTQADTPGVAVRASWSWKRPDGSPLPRTSKPIRYYTFVFDEKEPTKIADYSYTDRTSAGTPSN